MSYAYDSAGGGDVYIGENQMGRWIIRGYDRQIQEQARNHVNILAFAINSSNTLLLSTACMTLPVLYNLNHEHGKHLATLSLSYNIDHNPSTMDGSSAVPLALLPNLMNTIPVSSSSSDSS